jgi:hypothetical protein
MIGVSTRVFMRLSGPAAVLGGLLWIAGTVVNALKPEGCVGAECDLPGRSMRGGGALDAVLFIAAVPLIGVGAAALVVRARRAGRFGRLGRVGLLGSVVGAALLLTAGLVQALFFGGDFPYMPLVVIPGGLAAVSGVVTLGIAVLRAGVLPRWAGALLIVGALAMLGFNDQNAQALMAIPFGVAWAAAGYALWSAQAEQPAQV